MKNSNICFICNNSIVKLPNNHYYKCKNCGHEIIDSIFEQKFIINEPLNLDDIATLNLLDKYKNYILTKYFRINIFCDKSS